MWNKTLKWFQNYFSRWKSFGFERVRWAHPRWHVMMGGQVIQLSVTSLDVESDDDADAEDGRSCSYDCLQVFDGDTVHSEPLTARLCGHVAPSTTFITSSNAACVHFRSDYFTTGAGFQLEYHVVVPRRYLQTQRRTGMKLQLHGDYILTMLSFLAVLSI